MVLKDGTRVASSRCGKVTYGSMILAYTKAGNLEGAEKWYKIASQKGVQMNRKIHR